MHRVIAPLTAWVHGSTPLRASARRSPSPVAPWPGSPTPRTCQAHRSRAPCCWPGCGRRARPRWWSRSRYARPHGTGVGGVWHRGRPAPADRLTVRGGGRLQRRPVAAGPWRSVGVRRSGRGGRRPAGFGHRDRQRRLQPDPHGAVRRAAPRRRRHRGDSRGHWHGEPVGAVVIASGTLGEVVVAPADVPLVIDELPGPGGPGHLRRHLHGPGAGGAARQGERSDHRPGVGTPGHGRLTPTSCADGFAVRSRPAAERRRRRRAPRPPPGDGVRGGGARRDRDRPPSTAPTSSRCPSRASSRPSTGCGRDRRQGLPLAASWGPASRRWPAALARRLDWQAEDIDDPHRDASSGATSPASSGRRAKPYFRAVERQVLVDLLPERGVVVATGGGTFVDPANRDLMLRDGAVAWLDVPLRSGRRARSRRTAGARSPPIAPRWSGSIINASPRTSRRTARFDVSRAAGRRDRRPARRTWLEA